MFDGKIRSFNVFKTFPDDSRFSDWANRVVEKIRDDLEVSHFFVTTTTTSSTSTTTTTTVLDSDLIRFILEGRAMDSEQNAECRLVIPEYLHYGLVITGLKY